MDSTAAVAVCRGTKPESRSAAGSGQRPLAKTQLDIDHLKSINDRCGHATGDRVLTLLAQLLQDRVRASDVAVRQGGGEFVIVLPDTTCRQPSTSANAYASASRPFLGVSWVDRTGMSPSASGWPLLRPTNWRHCSKLPMPRSTASSGADAIGSSRRPTRASRCLRPSTVHSREQRLIGWLRLTDISLASTSPRDRLLCRATLQPAPLNVGMVRDAPRAIACHRSTCSEEHRPSFCSALVETGDRRSSWVHVRR